ncbi:short-chain dehydrogenase/reductase SDR [Monoraphidium neglectum]|uniref:Short-chain dehydrogenase/reductase SDR n=1 Tax=Monoraphidium neglectum TaxID=145388 RepID=A0A0D2KAJ6_9CHLO|nr:short-chain dehydrogenase/reductase SDR [Monoraphidium neglectum]KIZ07283.1 short-chain dehydrogenase/reductase SDR [Monoraphidium neglectum]|eukprot:XP_013906302.1 short-chain dehydrogenase/reductase SDR [Monoraphidium neglectum]
MAPVRGGSEQLRFVHALCVMQIPGLPFKARSLQFLRQLLAPERRNTCVAAARRVSPELKQLQEAHPGRLVLTHVDVADESSISDWAKGLAEQGTKLDVVINNAGVYGPRSQQLDSMTRDIVLDVFTTNALGPLLVVQQLRRQRVLKRPALVANVTSKMGSVDDNTSGACYAYRASKSALNIMTKSMAIDLAPEGVTCVLLHPGYVRTPMTGGAGLIDVDASVGGMISVLETRELSGRWYAFDGKEIPW